MKGKILAFVLSVAFLLSLVCVQALITLPASITLTETAPSAQATINFTTASNVNFSTSTNNILVTSTALNNVTSVTFNITATSLPVGTSYAYLYINATNTINASENESKTYTITLQNNTEPYKACALSLQNKLKVTDLEISTKSGFGEDEDFWYPMDEVEVSFNVENDQDYEINNIDMTVCLLDNDASSPNCVLKQKNMDISDDDFDLDEGDDKDITLTFIVDADKLKAGNTNYYLYITATGKINADSSDPLDGSSTCTTLKSDNIEIRTDEQFFILGDIKAPDSVSCRETFEITADLWNLGDEDVNNDEVYLLVYNKELGIDETIDFNEDFDAFESRKVTFSYTLPKTLTEKTYNLELSLYSDDSLDDSDIYQNSEDDEAKFDVALKVEKCSPTIASASIDAELSSETPKALIGSQIVVEATIKNTGTATSTFSLAVSGNSDWSNVAEIDPETFTLNAGESKKALIYLDIDSDAEAEDKEFTIKVTQGTAIKEQKVSLTLEKGMSFNKIIDAIKKNWLIYVIVLVNIILIVAIILVVRSIIRKS
jgi:hypothetical protein